jgi:hypothetical protein
MSYPTGDPNRPTARAALKPGMTFTILVPAHPRAAALALVERRGRPKDVEDGKRTKQLSQTDLLVVPLDGGTR